MNPFPRGSCPYHDARISLHVVPLTNVQTPMHAPSDRSAVFPFVAPLTDVRIPLHAPSYWSAVSPFVSPLIGVHTIYVFLLLTYAFSQSHETLTLPLLLL